MRCRGIGLTTACGLRTTKTVGTSRVDYYRAGGLLLGEVHTNGSESYTINYMYDESGRMLGFRLDGAEYYYVRDYSGDVTGLINSRGELIGSYLYDPWGVLLETYLNTFEEETAEWTDADRAEYMRVLDLNPIRYKSYYYDTETGFYYLQSRYYDPITTRFINADSQINSSLGALGFNQFAYCLNNPIKMADYAGNKPGDLFDTMDEAARDFAEYTNGISIVNNREYASYIYKKTVWTTKTITCYNPNAFGKNLFSRFFNYIFGGGILKTVRIRIKVTKDTYVKPSKGSKDSSKIPINWFGIHDQVALLHTHAAYDPSYMNDVFSQTDKNLAERRGMPIYVATPLGTLRRYNPSDGTDIILFEDLPFDSNHPGRK